MFRSLSRSAAAVCLVLAFLLSTVPAQAQPRDFGPGFSVDLSWLEAALGWLGDLLGGGGSEGLETVTTSSSKNTGGGGVTALRTGPCIDPYGCPESPTP